MVDLKETFKQFMMTSILGLGSKILTIFISGWLDPLMNHSLANFIGLIINAALDFFMMKKVFKVEEQESSQFIVRYTISIITAVIVAQLLYMAVHAYIQSHYKKWAKKNWEKYVFWIRYATGALAYGFVEFPMHKFWVFKK
jgi:riboflavin transporter FmnP